jgi:hypothetical protein
VVVFTSGGGSPEAIFKLPYEFIAKGLETWIFYLGQEGHNVGPIGILLLAGRSISGEELFLFFVSKNSELPSFSIDPIPILSPLAR